MRRRRGWWRHSGDVEHVAHVQSVGCDALSAVLGVEWMVPDRLPGGPVLLGDLHEVVAILRDVEDGVVVCHGARPSRHWIE